MTLREWLKIEGLTPAEFAMAIGVSRVTVYRWLSGTRRPRLGRREDIAAATRWRVLPPVWDVAQ